MYFVCRRDKDTTIKKNKKLDTKKYAVINPKSLTIRFNHIFMCSKDADEIPNSVDLDQTAPSHCATSCENVSSRIFDQVRFKPACSATEAS